MATFTMFGKFGANILGGEAEGDALTIDYLTDAMKHTLHSAVTSFDVDADEVLGDVLNELTTSGGYTAGGYTLLTKTATYSATGNKTVFDCADPTWTGSGGGFTARGGLVYRDGTTDPLVGYLDFGSDQVIAASDVLTINIDATNGLFYVTAT